MQIDNETYCVNEINRHKTQSVKTQIVLAASLRKGNNHVTRLLHKDFGKTKKWNTYTVSRDGTVFQHYDAIYHSDFLGIKEVDKQSISIVLENMGCLFETNNKHINWINEICDEDCVIKKSWGGYHFWENFPDAQLNSVAELCRELCTTFNIPKVCIEFHNHHKDTFKFKGIVFRSNYVVDSSDISPLFDIAKFSEMLDNE